MLPSPARELFPTRATNPDNDMPGTYLVRFEAPSRGRAPPPADMVMLGVLEGLELTRRAARENRETLDRLSQELFEWYVEESVTALYLFPRPRRSLAALAALPREEKIGGASLLARARLLKVENRPLEALRLLEEEGERAPTLFDFAIIAGEYASMVCIAWGEDAAEGLVSELAEAAQGPRDADALAVIVGEVLRKCAPEDTGYYRELIKSITPRLSKEMRKALEEDVLPLLEKPYSVSPSTIARFLAHYPREVPRLTKEPVGLLAPEDLADDKELYEVLKTAERGDVARA